MEDDQGEEFETVNNNEINVHIDREEDDNPNAEIQSGTVVLEHAVRIDDNERQEPMGSGWLTLKVPTPMFQVDEGAYVPKIVSIGPFYHNEPSLQAMQTQKQRFLDRLVQNQTRQPIHKESDLKNAMRELEEKTRKFYADDFQTIEPDDFVQMMLLDGCFIVELLRFYDKNRVGEPLFKARWTWRSISRDLLLLQNQLPLFLLEKIFELTTLSGEASLITLALRYFEPLRPGRDKFTTTLLNTDINGKDIIHLLDLFHFSLTSRDNVYSHRPVKSEKKEPHLMLPGKGLVRNAKTLGYAGIKFKKNSGSILDIKLKGKTLKIPTIVIDDSTGPLLRNLIAYEQNNRDAAPYFCCLALFLDSIVDTVEDVKILRDAMIIKQAKGGDEEVVHLFNSLTKELVFDIDEDDCYMTEQIEKINHLCRVHDTKVRIRRLLARLNYNGSLKTLFYIAFTIILSYIASNSQNGSTPSTNGLSPPPALTITNVDKK